MTEHRVVIVMLRQPRLEDPTEMRTDPLWELGSFGCTGCHRKNLMNPKKLIEHDGARLAFAQNGQLGLKLVHVTPPVRMIHHGMLGEATWAPAAMPMRYDSAPTLLNNSGASDVSSLVPMIRNVRRGSPVAQFASKFRSRRQPLPYHIGQELLQVYSRFRASGTGVAQGYEDALPYLPPRIDTDRKATYRRLLARLELRHVPAKASRPPPLSHDILPALRSDAG